MQCATQHRLNKVVTAGTIKKMVLVIAMTIYLNVGKTQSLLDYVQPLSGTAPSTTISALKHSEAGGTEQNANTIPAVGLPFGMTQWVAQTRCGETKCIPPYVYQDSLFTGIRGTHWISGSCMQDYGSVTIMPVTGNLKLDEKEYAVPFSHQSEITTPAYYKLTTAKFTVELTASLRSAMMRITMQQDDSLYLLVTPNSDYATASVQTDLQTKSITSSNAVHRIYQGWGQTAGFSGWHYLQADKGFASSGTFAAGKLYSQQKLSNEKKMGAYIGYYLRKGEQVVLKLGTSFTSSEAAANNADKEIGSKSFDEVWNDARQEWEKKLAAIEVTTKDERLKRIFYTAMYHAMQHPRMYDDVSGTYPSFAGNASIDTIKEQHYYDDFSMWDIYRTQLPLLEIVDANQANDFAASLLLKAKSKNWLPIFPCWNSYTAAMIGDHASAYIAGVITKGLFKGYENTAYAFMRKNAFETPPLTDYKNGMGRRALPSYLKYGFIPMEDTVPDAFHKKEQVSRTLEYAFDDYAVSTVAKRLKKTTDYALLRQRSNNYKNVFDTAVSMVRGRYANGEWVAGFNADKRDSYITEGTARQYGFYAPQDVPGLVKLMGGKKKLEQALDLLFDKNEYWHGNEPGHQIPFMYNWTASPWKTQQAVRRILEQEYSDGPGGLSGNDDAGQMSAWYVMAAMGFYPVNPVPGEYQLSAPIFDEIKLLTNKNKDFIIRTHKASDTSWVIKKITWNKVAYKKSYITYPMLTQGGVLEIWLVDSPHSKIN